jgi:hypothetical protein
MSIHTIHLNKLLRFLYLPEAALISRLRSDIREEIRKEKGVTSEGGHFYMPFWADVKSHVLGKADLTAATDGRVAKRPSIEDLYRQLEKGFLALWERGGNQKIEILDKSPKGIHEIKEYSLKIKVDNIMAIAINGKERLGYPYWFPDPFLNEEGARMGLWVMSQALTSENSKNFRIFDIIRSNFFSLENAPLKGNEEEVLLSNFERISNLRDSLRQEYPKSRRA